MERSVYRERGVLIATDYLVNSGGVIFAAQEHLIKTPDHLRFPEQILGDRNSVETWLAEHQSDLQELAEKRRVAAENARDEVIRRNMRELIDLLSRDADMLPCEAAEKISVRRIATSESSRTAADIMERMPTISRTGTVQEAAEKLIQSDSSILGVESSEGALLGVVTEWDITRATAVGHSEQSPVSEIMTDEVICASPTDSILRIVRRLENHEISAMPVVDGQKVLGVVSTDLLARRSLPRLLLSEIV
jgi:glutamate dehydrogenase (NAD(P)+)